VAGSMVSIAERWRIGYEVETMDCYPETVGIVEWEVGEERRSRDDVEMPFEH
jgi:hypothetical protein